MEGQRHSIIANNLSMTRQHCPAGAYAVWTTQYCTIFPECTIYSDTFDNSFIRLHSSGRSHARASLHSSTAKCTCVHLSYAGATALLYVHWPTANGQRMHANVLWIRIIKWQNLTAHAYMHAHANTHARTHTCTYAHAGSARRTGTRARAHTCTRVVEL